MLAVHARRTAAYCCVPLLAAACMRGDDNGRAAAESAATYSAAPSTVASGGTVAPAPRVVTVTASDYSFDAPAEVPAGLTTLRLVNKGPSLHHVQLVRLDAGKTPADFLDAMKTEGPPPSWARMAGGPNPSEVGQAASSTVPLEPGQYVLICFIPASDGMPHVMKGMSRALTVTGPSGVAAAEPQADVVMTLTDSDFTLSQPLTAGAHTIRVENAGPQPHEVALVRLKAGKTPEDFAKWGMHPTGAAPGTLYGGVSGIEPGTHAFVQADLPAGEYALLCFVPDGKDGKGHYAHGMAKRITIS
jgi:uncharacterized cupredoxin-like copper-binding protein